MDTLWLQLQNPLLGQAAWLWVVFAAVVVALLAFDLGVLHRDDHDIGIAESLWLSAGYIGAGTLFGVWLWWQLGGEHGIAYFTGYAIEKSLSMDNVFVIALIFGHFAVPRIFQHRVLFWGVLGVIVLRGLMIAAGAALVSQFHGVLYLFGAFLVLTGVRMLWTVNRPPADLSQNKALAWIKRHMRVTPELHGNAFFVRQPHPVTGRAVLWATPLFLALCMVELADLVFAVDSVPAIFAITTEPFVVYTSNIFAILGLRALYFALAAMMHRFHYLKHALALLLVFIGSKIFIVGFVGKIPAAFSLSVTLALLVGGVVVSLWKTRGSVAPPQAQAGSALPG